MASHNALSISGEWCILPTYTNKTKDVGEKHFDENIYHDVLPFDTNRICLRSSSDGYINASPIKINNCPIKYIAASAPLPNTFEKFWKMIIDENCDTIVMLTNLLENNKIKAYRYWPDENENYQIDKYKISCVDVERPTPNIVMRTFRIVNNISLTDKGDVAGDVVGVIKYVTHIHFTGWPDQGIPDDIKSLEIIINHLKDCHKSVIHCSAGIGRTGVMIAIMGYIDTGLPIFAIVTQMRYCREQMVQTKQQYRFLHHVCSKISRQEIKA